MKRIFWTLATIAALATTAAAAADTSSANFMLPSCKSLLARHVVEDFQQGHCAGLIEGLAFLARRATPPHRSCRPDGVTTGQVVRTIVRWLNSGRDVGMRISNISRSKLCTKRGPVNEPVERVSERGQTGPQRDAEQNAGTRPRAAMLFGVHVWMPPKMQGVFLDRESCDQQRSCVRPCCAALTMPLAGMAMRGSAPEQNGELEALWTPLADRPRAWSQLHWQGRPPAQPRD